MLDRHRPDRKRRAKDKHEGWDGRCGPRSARLRFGLRHARGRRVVNVHEFLLNFLEENPVKDADAFMRLLSKASPEIAMRVMEVRAAYAEDDFEWQNSRRLALENMRKVNGDVMREHATAALAASMVTSEDPGAL